MNRPIAIFDSGVGGFTVVRDIMRLLPKENIVYVGDTARAPYGNRTAQDILQFSDEICSYMMKFNPKLIVIACNTATAISLDRLREKYEVPIIGVIEAGVRAALNHNENNVIGVIGTQATINSGAYENQIKSYASDIDVISYACPAFVPLVEENKYETEEAYHIVKQELDYITQQAADCVILGCTHYPFLKRVIQRVLGAKVKLIHSGYETAKQVKAMLIEQDCYMLGSKDTITADSHIFVCTGELELFQNIGKRWLSHELYGRSCEWKSRQSMTRR